MNEMRGLQLQLSWASEELDKIDFSRISRLCLLVWFFVLHFWCIYVNHYSQPNEVVFSLFHRCIIVIDRPRA
uniref:Uncharacterized protein n=1 Tax=Arundo donax TaxID=35708 RepID=A0A0A9DPI6_ARUDO